MEHCKEHASLSASRGHLWGFRSQTHLPHRAFGLSNGKVHKQVGKFPNRVVYINLYKYIGPSSNLPVHSYENEAIVYCLNHSYFLTKWVKRCNIKLKAFGSISGHCYKVKEKWSIEKLKTGIVRLKIQILVLEEK